MSNACLSHVYHMSHTTHVIIHISHMITYHSMHVMPCRHCRVTVTSSSSCHFPFLVLSWLYYVRPTFLWRPIVPSSCRHVGMSRRPWSLAQRVLKAPTLQGWDCSAKPSGREGNLHQTKWPHSCRTSVSWKKKNNYTSNLCRFYSSHSACSLNNLNDFECVLKFEYSLGIGRPR